MSSPNHPTSNIEDAFSSTHSPDYTTASSGCFLASPGTTSLDPSDNLSKYLLASLAISPFHDDSYMKVMHAYDAIIPPQAPIAPTIFPSSPVLPLLPMFDPQDLFLPKEILPPRKQAHFLSLSSNDLSAQPQAFEIGENYYGAPDTKWKVIILQDFDKLKTELQEARAQIVGLQRKQMRHNDKISLARFRISTLELIIKDIQILILCCLVNVDRMDPKRTSTSAAPAMNQAAIRQLIDDRAAAALEAQAANMANIDNTNRNPEPRETPAARKLFSRSNCTEDYKVKFSTGTLTEDALSWWNSYAKPIGIEQADMIS
nr:reverse transcriptase domain-containing protein [Tanacetum cinerariifolium]